MKKLLAKLLIALTILTSLNANAIVGLIADDSDLAVFGVALMDISQITVVDRRDVYYRHRDHYDRHGRRHTHTNRVVVYTWRTITYVPLALTGLFFLNDAGSMEFKQLAQAEADKLGISADEMQAYNDEVEQINAIAEEVKAGIADVEGEEAKVKAAGQQWTEFAEYLSPEAATVLKLVGQQLAEQK